MLLEVIGEIPQKPIYIKVSKLHHQVACFRIVKSLDCPT